MILTLIQDSCNYFLLVIQWICVRNDKIFPADAHSDDNGLFKGYFGVSLHSFDIEQ